MVSCIEIVKVAEDDVPRILEIEREAISPPWTHGALLGELYRSDSFFSLAAEGGLTLGFCILRRVSDEGELLRIAVDNSARRRGIGDMLMEAALRCAADSGLCSVYLEVRKSNAAAIALYKKHGFKTAGKRKNYYDRPVEDALVMAMEIC